MKLAIILSALFALVINSHGFPFQGRIIGGQYTNIEDVPYQAALLSNGWQICGASIISEYWCLTAAHCVVGNSVNSMSVAVGTSQWGSGGSRHRVSKMIYHYLYNQGVFSDYDYALILVQTPFPVGSPTVQAIRLATSDPADGATAIVSGWGNEVSRGSSLKKAWLPIVSRGRCRQDYGQSAITDRMICAGWPKGGDNTCQGDSGGPLVVNGLQVGIVSWAYGCAQPNYPTVFADVANQRNWIREQSGV